MNFLSKLLVRFGIRPSTQATAFWSFLESFSSPLFSLLLIPVLTYNIGLEEYGLYVMVMAFIGLCGFSGIGMSTSITYYLAVNIEMHDEKKIAERLGTALIISLAGTIIFSMVFILITVLCWPIVQNRLPQLVGQEHLIFAALILLVFTQCDMVISAALKGLQKFKVSSLLEFSIRAIGFAALVLVATELKDIKLIIFSLVMIAFLGLLFRYNILRKVVGLKLNSIRFNGRHARELLHFGKWMTLQNIAGALFGSLDKLVIGGLLGNKVVGIYNVLLSVTQLIHFVPTSMLSFVMPKVAKNNKSMPLPVFKKISIITTCISGLVALVVLMLKNFIFSKFLIDESFDSVFYWLIISYVLLSLNAPSYFVALGFNLIRIVSLQCIAGSIVGILLLLVLVTEHGVLGAVSSKISYSLISILLVFPVLVKIRFRDI